MMDDVESRIAAFYRTRNKNCRDQPYLRFDPKGPFTYLFSPRADGVSLLSNRISGEKIERRVISSAVRIGSYWPDILRVFPGMYRSQVAVPEQEAFELAISSSRQTTILSPNQGIAATIGWKDDSGVVEEINTRQRLPMEINSPRLLNVDREFPYFITEYINGRTIDDPVADWEHVLDALVQLRVWYKSNEITWVSTNKAISDFRIELAEYINDPVISKGFDHLASMDLPDQLARGQTHGDFYGQNLLVSNGDVYILDWEIPRHEFLIRDFVTPFLRWLQYGGDKSVLSKLFYTRGIGKEISTTYARNLGPTIWGSKEWMPSLILFTLLQQLARKSPSNPKWQHAYEQCEILLHC